MNRDEWAQQALDQLRAAIEDAVLGVDDMRAVIDILQSAADRAMHGSPAAAGIERN